MFKELLPVIGDRPLTITVNLIPDGRIRVCVIPQSQEKDSKVNAKVGYQEQKEVAKIPESAIKALTTPLAITGTAEELDKELPAKLTSYAEAHVQLQHGITQATEEINSAVKAIAERNKNKSKPTVPPKDKDPAEDKETKRAPSSENPGTLPLSWLVPSTQSPAETTRSDSKENVATP